MFGFCVRLIYHLFTYCSIIYSDAIHNPKELAFVFAASSSQSNEEKNVFFILLGTHWMANILRFSVICCHHRHDLIIIMSKRLDFWATYYWGSHIAFDGDDGNEWRRDRKGRVATISIFYSCSIFSDSRKYTLNSTLKIKLIICSMWFMSLWGGFCLLLLEICFSFSHPHLFLPFVSSISFYWSHSICRCYS